jgi:glycosyltransferase involved in cell wall biosynthesis
MTESPTNAVFRNNHEVSDPAVLTKNPVVSVLMLAYNHGPYLAQAIEGVLAQQSDMPIELLIGEDCSPDDTREIALRYQRANPQTIRVFSAEQNLGSSLNHRRILLAARGEFHAYLDGDDYWLPGKLARQVGYLRENPACAAVYTNALTVDQHGNIIGLFNDVGNEQFNLGALVRRGNFLNNSSIAYRATSRNALLGVEGPAIDYRVHLLLAQTGFLAQIQEPLTVYRIGSIGSMVAHGNNRVRQLYWEAIMSVPRELVTDHEFAQGVADFLRRVIFRVVRTRQAGLLREWAPRVFATSPYGVIRTSFLVAGSVVRMACKELIGRVRKDGHGHLVKVLYRR